MKNKGSIETLMLGNNDNQATAIQQLPSTLVVIELSHDHQIEAQVLKITYGQGKNVYCRAYQKSFYLWKSSYNVYVDSELYFPRYFEWNFKDTLWNSTQTI